jgi:hypothetical protein
LEGILFFKKNKIKKKFFKKNTFLIKKIKFEKVRKLKLIFFKFLYEKYFITKTKNKSAIIAETQKLNNTVVLNISQKIYNNKATIMYIKNLHTFSIGSIIEHFKVKQGKYVRRSLKGVKIFLNFLKNFFIKKFFFERAGVLKKNIVLHIDGFDYNLFFLKKNLKKFFAKNTSFCYQILNLKVSYCKVKDKKIKSIKKRLKKKIILNFIKSNKIKK